MIRTQMVVTVVKFLMTGGLRLLACCDRGFESHRGHGCLSLLCVL
jgi:hypothetical protein